MGKGAGVTLFGGGIEPGLGFGPLGGHAGEAPLLSTSTTAKPASP